jgi:hypothetical protein
LCISVIGSLSTFFLKNLPVNPTFIVFFKDLFNGACAGSSLFLIWEMVPKICYKVKNGTKKEIHITQTIINVVFAFVAVLLTLALNHLDVH